jgi:hypothetical protein
MKVSEVQIQALPLERFVPLLSNDAGRADAPAASRCSPKFWGADVQLRAERPRT